jgi:hypothetical protein
MGRDSVKVAGRDQGQGKIDSEGRHSDRGPCPQAEDKQGHQRDPGRRPHRRHLPVHEGKPEAEACRDVVRQGDQRQSQEVSGRSGQPADSRGHLAEYRRTGTRRSIPDTGWNK